MRSWIIDNKLEEYAAAHVGRLRSFPLDTMLKRSRADLVRIFPDDEECVDAFWSALQANHDSKSVPADSCEVGADDDMPLLPNNASPTPASDEEFLALKPDLRQWILAHDLSIALGGKTTVLRSFSLETLLRRSQQDLARIFPDEEDLVHAVWTAIQKPAPSTSQQQSQGATFVIKPDVRSFLDSQNLGDIADRYTRQLRSFTMEIFYRRKREDMDAIFLGDGDACRRVWDALEATRNEHA
jgi:hypothetical protein